MYNEWVDNAIKVGQGIEQLQAQKMEIERRIGILQAMEIGRASCRERV